MTRASLTTCLDRHLRGGIGERLVRIGTPENGVVTTVGGLSLAMYQTIHARNTVFADMFGFTGGGIANLDVSPH